MSNPKLVHGVIQFSDHFYGTCFDDTGSLSEGSFTDVALTKSASTRGVSVGRCLVATAPASGCMDTGCFDGGWLDAGFPEGESKREGEEGSGEEVQEARSAHERGRETMPRAVLIVWQCGRMRSKGRPPGAGRAAVGGRHVPEESQPARPGDEGS